MREHRRQNTARTKRHQSVRRAAEELINRLGGIFVIERKQRAAYEHRARLSAAFQPAQHDAAENRLLENRGKNRHRQKDADQPEAVERGQQNRIVLIAETAEKIQKQTVELRERQKPDLQ